MAGSCWPDGVVGLIMVGLSSTAIVMNSEDRLCVTLRPNLQTTSATWWKKVVLQ